MTGLEAFLRVFDRLPSGAVEAEVNAETHTFGRVVVHDGAVIDADQSEQSAYYARVSGERTGYAYCQGLPEDPAEFIREGFENSAHSEKGGPDEIRRGSLAVKQDFGVVPAVSDISLLARYAEKFEKEFRSLNRRLSDAFVTLRAETVGLRTINSHGLDVRSVRPLYIMSVDFNAAAAGGQIAGTYNRTASSPDAFDPEEFARSAGETVGSRLNPGPFRSGACRTVLQKNVVYNIMSTAWQLFSGHRYLEGSCMLSGKLGQPVASPALRIVDRPSHGESGFSIPCDCEGTPGASVAILSDGFLTGLMHNLATAIALSAEPTGNAGRRPLLSGNIPTDILVTPRNFCVEPGSNTLEELIGKMGDGLLVTESSDIFHSINIASGAFSIPCRGIVIRGGERATSTGPLTMSGNLKELMESVEEAGNDFYLGTMLALDNYGIGACSLRVGKMDFSGA